MLCLICAVFFRVIFFHTKFTFTFIDLLNAIFAAPAPSSVIILSLPLLVNNAVSVQYILLGFILCAETAKNVDICQCWCYNTVTKSTALTESCNSAVRCEQEQKQRKTLRTSLTESFLFDNIRQLYYNRACRALPSERGCIYATLHNDICCGCHGSLSR